MDRIAPFFVARAGTIITKLILVIAQKSVEPASARWLLLAGAIAVAASCATLERNDEQVDQPTMNQNSANNLNRTKTRINNQSFPPQRQGRDSSKQAGYMDRGSIADWATAGIGAWAVYVAAKTYKALMEQNVESAKAVKAAIDSAADMKRQANASALALKLSHRPTLDIKNVKTERITRADNSIALKITWTLYNAGTISATIRQIDHVVRVAGSQDDVVTIGDQRDSIRGPDRGFDVYLNTGPLTTEQVASIESDAGIEIALQIRVLVRTLFEDRWILFTRRLKWGSRRTNHLSIAAPPHLNEWDQNYLNQPDTLP